VFCFALGRRAAIVLPAELAQVPRYIPLFVRSLSMR
jgi:hypothetical protein